MKQDPLSAFLSQDDEQVEKRIAEEFPPQFDLEPIYRRSIEKYYGIEKEPHAKPAFYNRPIYRAVGIAACLVLTICLANAVWSKQQKVEIRPLPETTCTAVSTVVTTTVETCAAISTQTAADQSETVLPTETTPAHSIPTETTMLSASISEVLSTQALQTVTTPGTTKMDTEPFPLEMSEAAQSSCHPETNEDRFTFPVQTTVPTISESTAPVPTETQTIPVQTTAQETVPTSEQTTCMTILPASGAESGFQIRTIWGANISMQEVIRASAAEQSDAAPPRYEMQTDWYTAAPLPGTDDLQYRLIPSVYADPCFTVILLGQGPLRMAFDAEDTIEYVEVGNYQGVSVKNDYCADLYWNDGHTTLRMTGTASQLDIMLELAASFVPQNPETAAESKEASE
ncbi:MAG: hypothetical protein IJ906_02230 [Oscillospiraceae bacterium]|nr:hypothetical protein [Oscillospiraceae bacterium]